MLVQGHVSSWLVAFSSLSASKKLHMCVLLPAGPSCAISIVKEVFSSKYPFKFVIFVLSESKVNIPKEVLLLFD